VWGVCWSRVDGRSFAETANVGRVMGDSPRSPGTSDVQRSAHPVVVPQIRAKATLSEPKASDPPECSEALKDIRGIY